MNTVKLVGLDFGTTTSSAVIASAQLATNSVTGRMDLAKICECYRSEMVFTPYAGDRLDEARLAEYVDSWLVAGAVQPEEVFGGGALLTGLAAQKENAASLKEFVRKRIGGAFIASADDPCLESWLAFMGNCARLSRAEPKSWFLNLDIGGGSTNLALGINGEVVSTGCLFIGARHVQVIPGTYRIRKLSRYARALFGHLNIGKREGEQLAPVEVKNIVGYYLRLLDAAIAGERDVFDDPIAQLHEEVHFRPHLSSFKPEELAVTLSGGVGELVYGAVQGKPLPATTHFGDLGIDLAERLLDSPRWAQHFRKHVPSGGGRATVYGLLRHSTQVSGSTVYLSGPGVLPLQDIPILGTITDEASENHLRNLIDQVRKSSPGGCLQICLSDPSLAGVRDLGTRISSLLAADGFPGHHPLIILVADNLGKVLGQYISQWGRLPLSLVVIDEIAVRDAHYVNLGPAHGQVIPVSLFGLES